MQLSENASLVAEVGLFSCVVEPTSRPLDRDVSFLLVCGLEESPRRALLELTRGAGHRAHVSRNAARGLEERTARGPHLAKAESCIPSAKSS